MRFVSKPILQLLETKILAWKRYAMGQERTVKWYLVSGSAVGLRTSLGSLDQYSRE